MTLNSTLKVIYKIIQQSAYKRMPWKNGLGETLEIFVSEDDKGQRFRISQAGVEKDGLFSDFPGLQRTLVLLSGEGMTLSHQNTAAKHPKHQLRTVLDTACFAGDDKSYAELKNGGIEDLNIMVRASDTKAVVKACFAPEMINVSSDDTSLLSGFYANQACTIEVNDTKKLQLLAHSFLLIEQAQQLHLSRGNGVFIQISATKVSKQLKT